ncbi:MAG: YerC/YecD family TrpR-related protein [Candidatus Doudnabacteria bacterium]
MIKWNNPKTNDLIEAVLTLKTKDEAKRFLRDLMTEAEIIEFGNRWKAAQMLSKNIPYTTIVKETGLSSTTIARVSQWLRNGMGGYRIILSRIR